MTEASEVTVISAERLELAVSSGSHRPPGAGLLRPAPPSLPPEPSLSPALPSTSTLACRSCTSTRSSADIPLVSIIPGTQRALEGSMRDASGSVSPAPHPAGCNPRSASTVLPRQLQAEGHQHQQGQLPSSSHPLPPASAIPAQTEMQPEALRPHPPVVSPWAPSRTSGCLCSIIILMPDSGLALIPHLQSVLTSVRASHLLPCRSNRKQLLCG